MLALVANNCIYTANVGDSRAILVQTSSGVKGVKAIALTYDHKPDIDEEKLRILSKGGLVATHSIASYV